MRHETQRLCNPLRLLGVPACCGALLVSLATSRVAVATASDARYVRGQVIVKFKSEGEHAVDRDLASLVESRLPLRSAVRDASSSLDTLSIRFRLKEAKALFQRGVGGRKHRDAPENVYVFEFEKPADAAEVATAFRADVHVAYAHPNHVMHAETVDAGDDVFYASSGSWGSVAPDLWGHHRINIESAWQIASGEGVVVAVVDTGIDYRHEDLASSLWINPAEVPNNDIDDDGDGLVDDVYGYDFTTCYRIDEFDGTCYEKPRDSDPIDDRGHGSAVAGVIAAADNGIGVIGVAPRARAMALKAINTQGAALASDLAEALIYGVEHGARVINNSWGGLRSELLEDAVRYAHRNDVVVVFSSGNSSASIDNYSLLAMDEVIAVGASGLDDRRLNFSNFGQVLDVVAPGGGCTLCYEPMSILVVGSAGELVTDVYSRDWGTSYAAPYVSGLAALILSAHPELGPDDVRTAITTTADDVEPPGFDEFTGFGRINAARALDASP